MTLPDKIIRKLQENTNLKLDKMMHPHTIKRHSGLRPMLHCDQNIFRFHLILPEPAISFNTYICSRVYASEFLSFGIL
jgi:hypothetical protein